MLLTKDREESINVTFDFASLAVALGLGIISAGSYAIGDYFAGDYAISTNPLIASISVEVARDYGDSALTQTGSPALSLSSMTVTQKLDGGTPGAVYDIACLATLADGERRRMVATLRVV